MARKVELINDSGTPWVINCCGGITVPATGSLDITDLISDIELVEAIQNYGLKDGFDGEHYLKINNIALDAAQSTNYLTYEQNGYERPRRIKQDAQPTPNVGEMVIWVDSNDGDKVYMVYNDTDSGVVAWAQDV